MDCNAGEKEASDTPELDMDNVGGVFLVLCVGLAVAWAIGVLEFFWSVRRVAIDEKVILARKMAFACNYGVFLDIFTSSISLDINSC